ncbi:MAG: MBL fold metallo-hydrolase [Bacteriovoracaceae bacterium]|nr:MBL fold metallo-hydrolase [Bacteriovoracaceae bacterium]
MIKLIHVLFFLVLSLNVQAELRYAWTGIAGVYLTDGKNSLFFDPVFSRPSIPEILLGLNYDIDEKMVKKELDSIGIKKIDGIFIGHSHFDHALDMHVVHKNVGGVIHGSKTTGFLALSHKVRDDSIVLIKNEDSFKFGDFTVTIVDSKHGKILDLYEYLGGEIDKPLQDKPSLSDYLMGGSFSFYVSHPDGDIFVHQASRTSDKIKKLLKGKTLKVLFQGIANRKSSESLYTGIIEQAKKVELVVPIHHDNFFLGKDEKDMSLLWGVDLEEFLIFSQKKNQRVVLPKYNEIKSVL